MDKQKELELKRKYPNVFRIMYVMPEDKKTPFHCLQAFGLECGDGWYDLIDRCSAEVEAELLKMPEEAREQCHAVQIKEKFGTLRFYMSSGTDEIYKIIAKAEEKSAEVCENCGAIGETFDVGAWLVTLCEKCLETREQRRAEELQKWRDSLTPEERAKIDKFEAEMDAAEESESSEVETKDEN